MRTPGLAAAIAAMALTAGMVLAGIAQAQAPTRGGTLRVAAGDPGAINPTLTSSGMTHPVTGQIFNGLIRLACTQPAGQRCNYEPAPDLAESWTISPDRKTYVFNLRRGVTWHDRQPFTSEDVVYSFEEALLKYHPRTRTLNGRVIQDVRAAGPDQVVFTLNQPYNPLLLFLDEDNGAILPKHLFEGTDPRTNPRNCPSVENCQPPVGTGPFKFGSRKADRIDLVRNDDYYEPGRPYLDAISFRFLAGDATAAFEREEVDLINPDPQEVDRLRDERGATVTEEGREGFARVVRFIPNVRPCADPNAPPVCDRTGGRNPFADKDVRKAIAYGIDKEKIDRVQYGGLAEPATGPLTRYLEPFYNPNTQPQYSRDVARANQMLTDAGFPRDANTGVRFQIGFIYDPGFAEAALALKRQLAEVGIEVTLDEKSFGQWVRQLYIERDFDLGYSNITDPADPEIGLRRTITCGNINPPAPFTNGAGYCNPDLDELFNRAAQEPDEQARAQLYFEIQDILADEQPNFYAIDVIGPYAYYANRFRGFEDAAPKTPYYFGRTVYAIQPPQPEPQQPEAQGPQRGYPPIDRFRGTSVWSVREGGRYFLVADRGGSVQRLGIAPRGVPFDVDLGPDEDGDVVAAYSRCDREPEVPAITSRLYSAPVAAYATGEGCDIYRYDFASGKETKLAGASTDQASEFLPSVWRDEVAFGRVYEQREGRRGIYPYLYVRPLEGGRSARQPGGSRGLTGLPGPTSVDLYGRRLSFVWNYARPDRDKSTQADDEGTTQVRLDTVGGDHRVVSHADFGAGTYASYLSPKGSSGRIAYGFQRVATPESEEDPRSISSILLRYRISNANKSAANPPGTVLGASAVDAQQLLLQVPQRFGPAPLGQVVRADEVTFFD